MGLLVDKPKLPIRRGSKDEVAIGTDRIANGARGEGNLVKTFSGSTERTTELFIMPSATALELASLVNVEYDLI